MIDGENSAGLYFRTVADYNPTQPCPGGLLRYEGDQKGREDRRRGPLWHYRWSSYARYRAWKKSPRVVSH